MGICPVCDNETGNYPIWVLHYADDPPICYCPRVSEDGEIIEASPCGGESCLSTMTMYPCQHCGV